MAFDGVLTPESASFARQADLVAQFSRLSSPSSFQGPHPVFVPYLPERRDYSLWT